MNILQLTEVLGNLGEFVGSVAVLATLIYLAMQVNHGKALLEKQSESLEQSNKIANSMAEAELLYRNVDWYKSIVDNPHVADLAVKLRRNETLSDAESEQARALTSQLLQLWVSSESYHKNGLINDSIHEQMLNAPELAMLSFPGLIPFISDSSSRAQQSGDSNTPKLHKRIRMALASRGYTTSEK
jgi:hypothetical protein